MELIHIKCERDIFKLEQERLKQSIIRLKT